MAQPATARLHNDGAGPDKRLLSLGLQGARGV